MYYFAYGSNMNFEHMRRLCGWHFRVLGMATLPDYELGPDKRGFATLRPQSGKTVYGVLYDVDQSCIDALDEFEGYPEIFERMDVTVKDETGKTFKSFAYIEPFDQFGGTYIKENYVKMVVTGARENHLPEQWITYWQSFPDHP